MEAFLVSLVTVGIAEIGDRTQLLSLVLAAHFRQPLPILGGILAATLANHFLAGLVGIWFGQLLTPALLDTVVGVSMIGMALWSLRQDVLDDAISVGRSAAFVATLTAFFICEIGDKTQIATVALAAGYANLVAVVLGTTCGMLAANVPVVILGKAFARRLPMTAMHYGSAALFVVLGFIFISRALVGR